MFRLVNFRSATVTTIVLMASIIPSSAAVAAPCWRPPVTGIVTDPFRAPACPFCAGNRGLEYTVGANAQVRAVAAGFVTWAGSIAGTSYVVVRHANGWRTTYGQLSASWLRTGDNIAPRSLIGTASASFYFGLRVGEEYRDPAPHLARRIGRPRLIPVDGSAARQPPRPRWRCTAES
jgi:murein DD-endopeptidase MepM/ murein hydrolase activator NlpD